MTGDPEIVEILNDYLTHERTAAGQYLLNTKMQENNGWTKFAQVTRAVYDEATEHAEILIGRILMLGGLPNLQRLLHVRIGQTITEMYQNDRQAMWEATDHLRRGIEVMRGKGDITSARDFEEILEDEEDSIGYLNTQLELIENLGEPLYLEQAGK